MGKNIMRILAYTGAAALTLVAGASMALGQATVVNSFHPAGATTPFPVVVAPGQISAFMTTPIGGTAANPFNVPDTVVDLRDSGGVLLRTNDDAGTISVGTGTVTPNRGSLVRYGETGNTASALTYNVRGFNATTTGPYAITQVLFTPGTTPGNFTDTEPNDTAATAQPITVLPGTAVLGYGSLGPADNDFFRIPVAPGDVISAFTVPLTALFTDVDTLMSMHQADGTLIGTNDDAGADRLGATGGTNPIARGSAIRYLATSSTDLVLSLRGFQ